MLSALSAKVSKKLIKDGHSAFHLHNRDTINCQTFIKWIFANMKHSTSGGKIFYALHFISVCVYSVLCYQHCLYSVCENKVWRRLQRLTQWFCGDETLINQVNNSIKGLIKSSILLWSCAVSSTPVCQHASQTGGCRLIKRADDTLFFLLCLCQFTSWSA